MKRLLPYLLGLGVLFLLFQWWDGQRVDEWEGRVKDAVGAEKKQSEAGRKANRDSLQASRDSIQRLKDSVTVLEKLPARLKIVTRTIREGFVTDTSARDSLSRALRVIALQDSTIDGQDSVIVLQKRQIGALEGSGRLWEVQRQADSSRIAKLEGLLQDRPSAKFLGFIPKPKCGPGGGIATNGQTFTPGLVLACIVPL